MLPAGVGGLMNGDFSDIEAPTMKTPPVEQPFGDGEFVHMLTSTYIVAPAVRQIILRKFSDLALMTRTALMPEEPERYHIAIALLAAARDAALDRIAS